MCEVCLPTCGICKPMSVVMFACEECEMPGHVTREEYLMYAGLPHRLSEAELKMHGANAGKSLLCKECGRDLLETLRKRVPPAPCKRSRIICGFPCGCCMHDHDPSNPCKTMVPVGPYPEGDLG